jgi:hypothetical protein
VSGVNVYVVAAAVAARLQQLTLPPLSQPYAACSDDFNTFLDSRKKDGTTMKVRPCMLLLITFGSIHQHSSGSTSFQHQHFL